MKKKISIFEEGIYKCLIYETDSMRANNISINLCENGEVPYLLEGFFSIENTIKGEYNITDCDSILDSISEYSGRDDIFPIIRKIVCALEELRNYFICEQDVILKKEYIYIEKDTKIIKLIGIPEICEESDTVYDLIEDILETTKWNKNENKSYLNVLAKAIVNRNISYRELISVIDEVLSCPVEYLSDVPIANDVVEQQEAFLDVPESISVQNTSNFVTAPSAPPIAAMISPVSQRPAQPISAMTSPVSQRPAQPISAMASPVSQRPVQPISTMSAINTSTPHMANESMRTFEASSVGETTVLGVPNQPMNYPVMIRIRNNEKVVINKNEFLIGKEPSKVDYCIFDNTAISRIHARLLCKNGEVFVVDNNSTNHIFVNGMLVDRNVEVRLNHGARVRLGDEEFEFRFQ